MLRSAAQTEALDGGRSVALCKVSAPGGCRNAPISPRGYQGARPYSSQPPLKRGILCPQAASRDAKHHLLGGRVASPTEHALNRILVRYTLRGRLTVLAEAS